MQRVFLSGGEPLLRRDLPEIVDMYSALIIGLPTNATRGLVMAPRLAGKVAFVNIGFDGPRATFSRVLGDYDKASTRLDEAQFWYTSAYVEDSSQCMDVVAGANAALASLMTQASLIAGHQLCSDLAVLAAAATLPPRSPVAAAAAAWRQRRDEIPGQPRFLDTRYDAGHILRCKSRRLVDVCAELRLDVNQPELRGTSMTALHHRWLESGDITAREKITVLNLRHSLSTAMVAARAAGLAHWQPGLNVNWLPADELGNAFGWLTHPVFTALLKDHDAA